MASFHGKFVWYELMTTDTAAATAFYRSVVGWGATEAPMPDMIYTLLTAGEAQIGGLMPIPKAAADMGARPGWIGYVAVGDVDVATGQVKQDGGAVYRAPDNIPGVGRFAIVADPQGAAFALFKGAGEPDAPPPAPDTPGHIGWHELHTSDREAAVAFYAKQFGWTKSDALDMGPMGVYQLFAWNGETIGGMMTKMEASMPSFWLYYFNVDDIDAAEARVKAAGGQVANGPQQVPGGSWILQAFDPQGAMFALVGPRR